MNRLELSYCKCFLAYVWSKEKRESITIQDVTTIAMFSKFQGLQDKLRGLCKKETNLTLPYPPQITHKNQAYH